MTELPAGAGPHTPPSACTETPAAGTETRAAGTETPAGERLQKVLARVGVGSRRACEELIAGGRVQVNGRVAVLGRRVDPASDRISVDGVPVSVAPGLVYYLLNKPAGVVSTASDPEGRPVVVDLVPAAPRVFPVGRLDAATEGLLLLTNDGELAHRLTHPRYGIEKQYLAEVQGTPSPGALRRLREGVALDDGMTSPARVSLLAPHALRITIHEGRNRQVRRMCEAVGHPVRRLVRTRIGPLGDQRLRPGEWRALEHSEVQALMEAASRAPARAAGPDGGGGSRPTPHAGGSDARPRGDGMVASRAPSRPRPTRRHNR